MRGRGDDNESFGISTRLGLRLPVSIHALNSILARDRGTARRVHVEGRKQLERVASAVHAPGPGHSADDHSLSVLLEATAPDGFVVHSFAGDDVMMCRDYVREKLGLPPFEAKRKNGKSGDPWRTLAEYVYRDAPRVHRTRPAAVESNMGDEALQLGFGGRSQLRCSGLARLGG